MLGLDATPHRSPNRSRRSSLMTAACSRELLRLYGHNGLGVSGSRSSTWLADHAGERVTVEIRLAHDLEASLRVEVDVRLRPGLEIARHPGHVRAGCARLHEGRPSPWPCLRSAAPTTTRYQCGPWTALWKGSVAESACRNRRLPAITATAPRPSARHRLRAVIWSCAARKLPVGDTERAAQTHYASRVGSALRSAHRGGELGIPKRRECAPLDSDLQVNRRSSSCDEIGCAQPSN